MQDDLDMEQVKVKIFGQTDTGRARPHNEDNLIVSEDISQNEWTTGNNRELIVNTLGSLLVVADGMGGAAAGEVASEICIDTIKSQFNQLTTLPSTDEEILHFLKTAIYNGHVAIVQEADSNPEHEGMGTTVNIGLIAQNKLYVAWSGDSRIYRYSTKGIRKTKSYDSDYMEILTPDHSQVWDQVEKGMMSAEQARIDDFSNIITQSLGDKNDPPRPDARVLYLREGDRVLACSDGLNSMLPDFQIEDILAKQLDPEQTCHQLVEAANNAGGQDNITVIVADIVKAPPLPVGADTKQTDNSSQDTTPGHLRKKTSIDDSSNNGWIKWVGIGAGLLLVSFLLSKLIGSLFPNLENQVTLYKNRQHVIVDKIDRLKEEISLHDNLSPFVDEFQLILGRYNEFQLHLMGENIPAETYLADTSSLNQERVAIEAKLLDFKKVLDRYVPPSPISIEREENSYQQQQPERWSTNGGKKPKPTIKQNQNPNPITKIIQKIDSVRQSNENAEQLGLAIKEKEQELILLSQNIIGTKEAINSLIIPELSPSFDKDKNFKEISQLLAVVENYRYEESKGSSWLGKVNKGIPAWKKVREGIQYALDRYKESISEPEHNVELEKEPKDTTKSKGN